jgi:hypothetical protein
MATIALPPKPMTGPRRRGYTVRLTEDELARFRQVARQHGLSIGMLLRWSVEVAARVGADGEHEQQPMV